METQVFNDALAESEITIAEHGFAKKAAAAGVGREGCRSLFFPGCSFLNADAGLVQEVYGRLKGLGLVDGVSLLCCGKILRFEPDAATLKPAYQGELKEAIAGHGITRIITACPNCAHELREVLGAGPGALIEVVALPVALRQAGQAASEAMVEGVLGTGTGVGSSAEPEKATVKLTVHDSCPDRASGEFGDSARALLPAAMLVEKEHNHATEFCCGSLASAAGHPDAALKQAQAHGAEARAVDADALVTYCMSCARILSQLQDEVPVHHYLEFLCGHPIDWKSVAPYLEMRFLFEDTSGKREYHGATAPRT